VLPVLSRKILNILQKVTQQGFDIVDKSMPLIADGVDIYGRFQRMFESHLLGSSLNSIVGLDRFAYKSIIQGCTQYIDNIYATTQRVQILRGDYRYHHRLKLAEFVSQDELIPQVPLLISWPFVGSYRVDHRKIIASCESLNIPVHIDCAWYTASSGLNIDLTSEAIASVGFSMSKGYGTGFNRVGLRYTLDPVVDTVSLQNDFQMVPTVPVQIGIFLLANLEPDHLWSVHGDNYHRICKDFDVTATNSIHQVLDGDRILGTADLLHFMENTNV